MASLSYLRDFAKGVAGTVSLPTFSVCSRFLPVFFLFSPFFSSFSPFFFSFFPRFSWFFFLVFFPFSFRFFFFAFSSVSLPEEYGETPFARPLLSEKAGLVDL